MSYIQRKQQWDKKREEIYQSCIPTNNPWPYCWSLIRQLFERFGDFFLIFFWYVGGGREEKIIEKGKEEDKEKEEKRRRKRREKKYIFVSCLLSFYSFSFLLPFLQRHNDNTRRARFYPNTQILSLKTILFSPSLSLSLFFFFSVSSFFSLDT